MNIAVLFSGRLTNYDLNYESLEYLVQDNSVDFYSSVSDEEINKNLMDDFQTIYHPVSLIKSDGKLFEPVGGWENVKSNSHMSPIKKMWRICGKIE